MVQSILYTTDIGLHYWGEVFIYAVHIWGFSSTIGLQGIIPYKAWTGCKSNVSHLHIFDSLGWAHVSKQVQKEKLEYSDGG